ncbi:MAG: phosphotransferase family protein [Dehalococcoidia bacterium]
MNLPDELHNQLTAFVRAHTADAAASIAGLRAMPGHAGFSYGFTAKYRDDNALQTEAFVLRLPPPGARYEGTADVLRQVRVLDVLRESGVPVAPVRWSGDDPRWFGRPYFIVPRLPGDTLRAGEGSWESWSVETLRAMAQQVIEAMAALHAVDWEGVLPAWGPPLDTATDVVRWDRFFERSADPELVSAAPEVRRRLLAQMPAAPHNGVVHGDFQWTNVLFDGDRLVAVLDWELVGIGPVLNDLGWIMVFSDPENWTSEVYTTAPLPSPAALRSMYATAAGRNPGDLSWYRALAGYKFAIISGFNLMLHRRGRRDDPFWELLAPSIPLLLRRALDLLDGSN